MVDLNEIVGGMERMLGGMIGDDVAGRRSGSPTGVPAVEADRAQLEQVMLNLAANARDAMPHGGRLTIETARRRRSTTSYVATHGEVHARRRT